MKKQILISLAALCAVSCGSNQPQITLPPLAHSGIVHGMDVDPQIARIFGEPPITGRLPSAPTWSPDGQTLAFLRKATSEKGPAATELWLHKVKDHLESPIFSDKELPVASYSWAGSNRLIVSAGSDIYLVELERTRQRLTETEAEEESVQVSPSGTRLAFVREHNLFVLNIETGEERQITSGGIEHKSFGEVTWVYGEEFGTQTGFGWSPDSRGIWFFATDESGVKKRTVVVDAAGNTRIQAYPRPGEPNPIVRIGVVDLDAEKGGETVWLDTGPDLDIYLPRMTWHPDSKRLLVQRLDRLQTLLDLLICDTKTGACSPLIEERDPRWVNLLGEPVFVDKGKQFLWLSERDGFAHIYRFGMDGQKKNQLTSGEWVVRSMDAVDEEQGLVYFTANAEKITDDGIYKVSLKGNDIDPVSKETGVHRAIFSPDFEHYLDTHSAVDRPLRREIHKSSGELVSVVAGADLGRYKSPEVTTDIFPIETSDGWIFMARLTRPRDLDPKRRYPVLINVYGGPHVQLVQNWFRAKYQPWINLMASRGVLVFSVDGRGTGGRGRDFECEIHRNLGKVELEDQLEGVAYLKTLSYVDPDRLAIFGWSYGGTMVLNALLRTEGVFKAGVSVAPVTDWREYDSAYTERYMQRPVDNPDGYEAASLYQSAGESDVPLLMVHGLADDNVHFVNSARMADAFIDAGKQPQLMFYPGKRHGISGPETRADLFTRITRFIEQHI